MKNNKNFNALNLILLMILSLTFISATQAQSTDIDNPIVLTSNVIEGEGDGNAETFYYSFTATKGDVKVTVDAKTDYYSTPLRVTLMDEDGKELLPIFVVAKAAGQREVKTKHFVRDTKVILRIRMDNNATVKLLSYKIKLDGAVEVETPPEPPTESTPTTSEQTTPVPSTEQPTSTDLTATPGTEQPVKKMSLKDKIKKKVKKETKKVVDKNLDN